MMILPSGVSTAFRKCSVLRAGPLNHRTSFALPPRGSTAIIVGLLSSHSHIGSPDFRRASLVVRAMTGRITYFCVIAMSCWMPTYGALNQTSLVTWPVLSIV